VRVWFLLTKQVRSWDGVREAQVWLGRPSWLLNPDNYTLAVGARVSAELPGRGRLRARGLAFAASQVLSSSMSSEALHGGGVQEAATMCVFQDEEER